jgi:hypothetical protein
MARRSGNLIKRNDGLRALKIACDGSIEPAMIESVAKDCATFWVYDDTAALVDTRQKCTKGSRGADTCALSLRIVFDADVGADAAGDWSDPK